MHIIDIIIFLLFTGGVVAFGCSFFKKKGTSEEFTSAGRSLPGWVVGMSIFATYVSSISYLGYPGKAFSGDWNAFVFSLSIRALFHVGWHEGCHLDRGHTGNYSDWRCVGMYVHFAF